MKSGNKLALPALVLISSATFSYAVTPPVESTESLVFKFSSYRNHDVIAGAIETDIPLYRADDRIFFTAEFSGGTLRQSRGSSYDTIGLDLGLKYYMFPETSLSLSGGYNWYLGTPNYDTASVNLRIRHAFLPEDAPVVPFARVNGSIQFIDPVRQSPARQDSSYSLLVVEALAGVQFRLRKDFGWVFEGGRSQSQAVNNAGPDLADGWIGRIAMQYDWF
jgi:hypothetical protein